MQDFQTIIFVFPKGSVVPKSLSAACCSLHTHNINGVINTMRQLPPELAVNYILSMSSRGPSVDKTVVANARTSLLVTSQGNQQPRFHLHAATTPLDILFISSRSPAVSRSQGSRIQLLSLKTQSASIYFPCCDDRGEMNLFTVPIKINVSCCSSLMVLCMGSKLVISCFLVKIYALPCFLCSFIYYIIIFTLCCQRVLSFQAYFPPLEFILQ